MEYIYKNISLDIHDDITSQLSLSVKQGDTARGIRVALTDHGKVFNIPDNCYAVFSARKSNNVFISDGCIIQNNTIIYNFTDAVVSVATQIDCELTIYSAKGEKITSPSFMIFVYKTIEEEYAGDVVESNSFTVLNDLISNATETIAEANEAIDRTNATIEESVEKTNIATEAAETATAKARASVNYIKKTEDGKLQILDADLNVIDTVDVCYMDNDTIYRYNNGVLRVVGIKELNADETFRMWVGTNAEYVALAEKDENTFYWISDDATFDEVAQAINNLNETFTEYETALQNGEFVVNEAVHAVKAQTLHAMELPSGADLNNFNDPTIPYGEWYSQSYKPSLKNCPTDYPFTMSIKFSGSCVVQEITEAATNTPKKYHRVYSSFSSSWSEWNFVPFGEDLGTELKISHTGIYAVNVQYNDQIFTGVIWIKKLSEQVIAPIYVYNADLATPGMDDLMVIYKPTTNTIFAYFDIESHADIVGVACIAKI